MQDRYTEIAGDRFLDIADQALPCIWEDIENTDENTSAEKWRQKLERIAKEYSFSSRYALMRFLCARRNGIPVEAVAEGDTFSVERNGKPEPTLMVSMERAESLSDTELQQYAEALEQIAKEVGASYGDLCWKRIASGLRIGKASQLSRSAAFELGHILDFSRSEMSWFLQRVFDYEDGFQYRRSGDLIEAYGFLVHAGRPRLEALKREYSARCGSISKVAAELMDCGWTQSANDSLLRFACWKDCSTSDQDEAFLHWMELQAPFLDVPSATAIAVYRRLALFADLFGKSELACGDMADFLSLLRKTVEGSIDAIRNAEEPIFRDPGQLERQCAALSARLLERNKELFTSAPDRAKAWRTVTISEKGKPKLIMAGRPDADRSRVQNLLHGDVQVEKGDMLHLLWYSMNLAWLEFPVNGPNDLFNALADFTEAAELVLRKALLPPFYPPHLMEQSMMLSIVSCSEDTGVPADVYAEICEALILSRKREKKH